MKRRVLMVALSLMLPACYEFDFPLDAEPTLANDARLLGRWRCLAIQGDGEDDVSTVSVVAETPRKTRWSWTEAASDGAKTTGGYVAFGSTVAGRSLLNFKELNKDAGGKWSFVRYEFLTPEILHLRAIDDKPFKNATMAATFRAAAEKRIDDPAIYLDLLVCARVKKEDEKSGR